MFRCVIALGVGILTCAAGCGGDDSKFGDVEGIVKLDGQPVPAGKVFFQPAAGRGATGAIQPDGTFTLETEGESSGALIGEHRVAVVAFQSGKGGRPDPTAPRTPMKALVPERYLAAGTSGLTFEVKPGDNHAELNLTSP